MICLPLICGGKPECGFEDSAYVDEFPELHNINIFSYKELKAATDGFSLVNKIGEGGFGPVYKLRNGKMAAMKILSSQSKQGVKEFLNEIKAISDMDHENLVKLYGCCVEGNHRILVYHYLENNSIARTLLSDRSSIHFSWPMRVKVCIGVARGLAFLHDEVTPHIIHRDIKASNILLDQDLNPKISDFGLAKLIPTDTTHISTRVAGTIGYLAPEYAVQGRVTRRADTYSFGVLLVEIVSGRRNIDKSLPLHEQYLLERAWQLHQKNELVTLVDPALKYEYDVEQACRFVKVGLLCTQDDPIRRPSMSNVVKMLTGTKDVDDDKIIMPGLISNFMDMKLKSKSKNLCEPRSHVFSQTTVNTSVTCSPCSNATISFTDICDRAP